MADFTNLNAVDVKDFFTTIAQLVQQSEINADSTSMRLTFRGRLYKIVVDATNYPNEINIRVSRRDGTET